MGWMNNSGKNPASKLSVKALLNSCPILLTMKIHLNEKYYIYIEHKWEIEY